MNNIKELTEKAEKLEKAIPLEKDLTIKAKMEKALVNLKKEIDIAKSDEKETDDDLPKSKKTESEKISTENIDIKALQFAQAIQQMFMGAGIDKNKVVEIAKEVISNTKIGESQLSDELLMRFMKSQRIQLISPDIKKGREIVRPQNPVFWTIVDDIRLHNNVFVFGEAGSGKTTLAKKVALFLEREIEMINCSQWTSPIEIIGGYTVEGQVEGKLIRAWRDGKILILDEMPKLDPNTAGLFNDALALADNDIPEENKISDFKGDKFSRHPNFACIATGNVYPNSYNPAYPANNKQDLSLLDRFSGNVYEVPLDIEGMKEASNSYVFNIGNKLRNVVLEKNYESVFSFRTILSFQRAWDYEKKRLENPDDVKIDEGKTFIKAVNSYILTFNKQQQEVLRQEIDFLDVAKNYRLEMKKS